MTTPTGARPPASGGVPPSPVVMLVGEGSGRALASPLAALGLVCRPHATVAALLDAEEPAAAGCLFLDLRAADAPAGVALAEALAREGRLPPLVALAGGEPRLARRLLQAGARDLLEAGSSPEDCVATILASMAPAPRDPAPHDPAPHDPGLLGRLTRRQAEVLAGIRDGLLNKQIAYRLGISIRTVEVHRAQLMARTGARGVAQLLRLALAEH